MPNKIWLKVIKVEQTHTRALTYLLYRNRKFLYMLCIQGSIFRLKKSLLKKNEFVGFEIEGRTVSILPVSVRRFPHIWKFTEQTMVYLAQCENSIAMSDRQLSCLILSLVN